MDWVLLYLANGSTCLSGGINYTSAACVGWMSCSSGRPRKIEFVPFLLMEVVD